MAILTIDSFRQNKTRSGIHIALFDPCEECARLQKKYNNFGFTAYWVEFKKGIPRVAFGFVRLEVRDQSLAVVSMFKTGGGIKDHRNFNDEVINGNPDLAHAWNVHLDRNVMNALLRTPSVIPAGCSGWWYAD